MSGTDNVFPFRPVRNGEYVSPLATPPDPLMDMSSANEQAFLGALLHNLKHVDHVPDALRAEHFGWEMHREVFRAAKALRDGGSQGGLMDVRAALMSSAEVTQGDLVDLYSAMIDMSPAAIRGRGETVLTLSGRRALRDALRKGIEDAEKGEHFGSLKDLGGGLLASIEVACGDMVDDHHGADLDEAMAEAMDAFERTMNGEVVGISTGFRSLDEGLGLLEPGQMIVLAARPGMGKTALAVTMAVAAARKGRRVLVISLEMSKVELGRRILCAASGVPITAFKRGQSQYTEAIVKAQHEMLGLHLRIEDASGQTPSMMAVRARAFARRKGGIDLIVIDHLHIAKAEGGTAEKHGDTQAVGQVSNAMKRLAKDMGCPVLALAQLNRGPENRDDKRPNLGDLRQSGNIEQDADAVMFLHRPEYYLPKGEPERKSGEPNDTWAKKMTAWEDDKRRLAGVAELIVAKNRDGAGPLVPLTFHGPTASFAEAPEHDGGRWA